jgi:hypothetical protein
MPIASAENRNDGLHHGSAHSTRWAATVALWFHLFEPKKAGRFDLAAPVQQLAVVAL